MNQKLIETIESIFFEKLNAKTGWGRNEIRELYKSSVAQAALELLDQNDNNAQ